MTTVQIVPQQDEQKPLPDPEEAGMRIHRRRSEGEREFASEYLTAALDLIYAAGYQFRDRADVTDVMRRDWLLHAADFAGRAVEHLNDGAMLLAAFRDEEQSS